MLAHVAARFRIWSAANGTGSRPFDNAWNGDGWLAQRDPDRTIREELDTLGQLGDGATTETRILVCPSRQTKESRTPDETAHVGCEFRRTHITLQTGRRSHPIDAGQANCTDLLAKPN